MTDKSKNEKTKVESMLQIVISQFLEHRFAVIGSGIIGFFLTIALAAPLISWMSGIDPDEQDIFNRFKGPFTRIEYSQDRKEYELEKYLLKNPVFSGNLKKLLEKRDDLKIFNIDFSANDDEFLFTLLEIYSPQNVLAKKLKTFSSNKDMKIFISMMENFSVMHLLGTDELGRDVLMRLIFGTRVSIGIGIMVALAAALIGLVIGSLAGFYGGLLDTILMRVTDSLLSLPLLPVLIVVAAIDLKKIPILNFLLETEGESIFKLVIVLCIFSWMTVARLVRGSILSLKEQEFIYAAKTLGTKNLSIILVHIIPNVVAPLLVAVTLNIGQSILSEAALSFLGLGIQPPVPSWGNMLFNAQEIIYEAPLLAVLPGLLILLVVVSFNFVGDGLQDAIDPKAIRR